MAIGVTALGTNQNKGTTGALTITGISSASIPVGSWLIWCIAADTDVSPTNFGLQDTTNVTITPTTISASNSGNVLTAISYGKIVELPTGDGTIDVSINGLTIGDSKAGTLYVITGLHDTPFDTSSTGTGTGTSPSSGASGTLAQSRELIIGAIGIEDNVEDIAGTWTAGSGNVSGNEQQAGTSGGGGSSNIVIRTAAEVVNATTAQTAGITGIASADWAALVATFREAADATVALGTPTEGQDVTDRTPDLVFTGTDPDSLDLEYQIQVDTSGSFNTIYDTCAIKYIDLYMNKINTPTDGVYLTICSGSPGNEVIATSGSVPASSILQNPSISWIRFTFPSTVQTSEGVYSIGIYRTGSQSVSNYYALRSTTEGIDDDYSGRYYFDGAWYFLSSDDISFSIYNSSLEEFITSGSGSGGGNAFGDANRIAFAQTFYGAANYRPQIADDSSIIETAFFTCSGDTHPFTSGSAVTYNLSARQRCHYQPAIDDLVALAASVSRSAQSFMGDGRVLKSASFWLNKFGTPAANCTLRAYIYGHTGTYGSSSVPNSTLYATSETIIYPLNLPTSATLTQFDFTGADSITLTSGSYYTVVLVVTNQTSDSGARYGVTEIADTQRHSGNSSYYASGWTVYNADTCFILETELPLDTYYWRVKASDNNGVTWGTWSSARSFDLVTSGSGGSVSVTPSAVSAATSKVDPTSVYGSLSIGPSPAISAVTTINPEVILGSISIEPAVSSSAASINPDIVLGSLSFDNLICSSIASKAEPTVKFTISFTGGDGGSVDSYIIGGSGASSNFGSDASILVGNTMPAQGRVDRGLIKFDLSGLPSDATITSCTLSLYLYGENYTVNNTVQVFPLKRNWIESEVTWNIYSSGSSWQVAGGFGTDDCGQSNIGTRDFSSTETVNEFKDFTLTPTVKSDLDFGNGWLIKIVDEVTGGSLSFRSSDHTTSSQRPKLVIDYVASNNVTIAPSAVSTAASVANPTVNIGGNVLLEPTPASVVVVSLNPEVVLGSVAVDPAPSQSAAQSIAPSVAFGSLTISPTSADSATTTLIEALALGSLTLELSALSSSTATIYPEVLLGSLALEPPALYSVADVVNPTVSIPSSTLEPSPVSSVASVISPTVTYGSLELVTSPASAPSSTSLDVALGSLTLAPQPASSATQSISPTVVAGLLTLSLPAVYCSAVSLLQEVALGSLALESPSANSGTAVVLSDIVHGSLSIPPGPAIATTSIVAPDVAYGSVNVSPEPVSVTCVTSVEIGTSSLVITPSPSYSSTESLLDFAILGSLTFEPIATSSSVALDPTVVFGNISIATAAAQCPAQALPPLVALGTLSVEPAAVETVASSINPETHQGSLSFTVIVATSSSVVYPTIVLSSTSVAGVVASASTSTVNPDIPLGSTTVIPPPVTVSSISISPSVFSGNQFSRPYIDYTNIGWKNELDQSTNLYESINEVTPNNSDYITATHGTVETGTRIDLQTIEDPEVHVLHKMRFRYKIDGTPQNGFSVSLYQGDTQIVEWSTSQGTDGYVDTEVELTEGQAASITDYSLLNVRFVTAGAP